MKQPDSAETLKHLNLYDISISKLRVDDAGKLLEHKSKEDILASYIPKDDWKELLPNRWASSVEDLPKNYTRMYEAATEGNASAQCTLGLMYKNGDGVEQSDKRAYFWLSSATKHPLSVSLEQFLPKDNSFSTPLKDIYSEAQLSILFAHVWLGLIHFGNYLKHPNESDQALAIKHLQIAGNNHMHSCDCLLGQAYHYGLLGIQDVPLAFIYYHELAEMPVYDGAQAILGFCYYLGDGIERDGEEAVKWFHLAASQENPSAQYALGLCYQEGFGVEKRLDLMVYWFKVAANNGVVESQYQLAIAYGDGDGVEADQQLAFEWMLKAAEQEHAAAQWYLSKWYEEGNGTEQDRHEALRWSRRSAENQCVNAIHDMGLRYAYGDMVTQDYTEAYHWWYKAAQTGELVSQHCLSLLYEMEEFEYYHQLKSLMWAYVSKHQGEDDVQEVIDDWLAVLSQEDIDYAKEKANECIANHFIEPTFNR